MKILSKIRIGTTENASRYHHYAAVSGDPDFEWVGTLNPPFNEESLSGIDAFICSCEHHWPTRLAIAACKRLGIPTFHVIDGIIEWRNLFENPRSSSIENGAPLFQPLISDHTFTMGRIQQWTLQWLGNAAVHATGLPRLDQVAPRPCRTGPTSGPPRLLVATANTPWFDEAQERLFKREFGSLVSGIHKMMPQIQCRWRVAAPVAETFNLDNQVSSSAVEALQQADALVTTPSSLAVEAVMLGVPTLIFDPYACPVMNPSAWSANSAASVIHLLPSLFAPQPQRASLQDSFRAVTAPTDGKATERVREFIHRVIRKEPVMDSPKSPAPEPIPFQSPFGRPVGSSWVENLSVAEMRGLVSTIPALDQKLSAKDQELERLYRERKCPTFRQALGCVYRSFTFGWQSDR